MDQLIMLKPFKLSFSDILYEDLANDKYAQVGSEKPKVCLLSDFGWSQNLIPWHDMLPLLEVDTV